MKEYEKVFSFRLYERITICVEKILKRYRCEILRLII